MIGFFLKWLPMGLLSFFLFFSLTCAGSGIQLNESFIRAAEQGNYPLMKELLKKGADINSSVLGGEFTALSSAASVGDLKLVKFLVENGADIIGNTIFPNSPIYFAISGGHTEVISFLLDKGIDSNYAWPNQDGGTLLISAIQFGYKEIVTLLVGRGADVNLTGNGSYGPLFRSIIYDRFEIFGFLVKHGAKLNNKDWLFLKEMKWEDIKGNDRYINRLKER